MFYYFDDLGVRISGLSGYSRGIKNHFLIEQLFKNILSWLIDAKKAKLG